MKDELGGKIMKKFVGLGEKTYSCLTDDGSGDKKAKDTKKCAIKRKLKIDNYKNCVEATQLENKISYLEKNKINIVLKNHKQFIRNNKAMLKTLQRLKSERHNIFTEEINKIALSSNDDKRMQSVDSIETYAYGTRKDLIREKEVIKCNNIIKFYNK